MTKGDTFGEINQKPIYLIIPNKQTKSMQNACSLIDQKYLMKKENFEGEIPA